MPAVSVIIPSYNQPDTIRRCVDSVLDQDFAETYEVIVVDSSSEPFRAAIRAVCERDERIQLVQQNKQTYPGAARNIGIQRAAGRVLAFIDSDCVAHKDWLQHIYQHIAEGVILTGVVENGTPDNAYGTCSFLVEFNHFLDPPTDRREVHAAATCNFACYRQVFERVGLFTDDRAFEDFLFCNKYRALGGKIVQIRDIRIRHVNKTELTKIVDNQRMLGYYSARVRQLNGMPPKLIFRFPFLSYGLLAFRYTSILSRVLVSQHRWTFVRYNPIIVYLLWYWTKGFYRGARQD